VVLSLLTFSFDIVIITRFLTRLLVVIAKNALNYAMEQKTYKIDNFNRTRNISVSPSGPLNCFGAFTFSRLGIYLQITRFIFGLIAFYHGVVIYRYIL
jgi:hypothetical protein